MQIKKVVYKNRIRLKEFFVDFDKVSLTAEFAILTILICSLSTVGRLVSRNKFLLLQLRSGFIFENQFLSGLSMAGLDKQLTPTQLQA